MAETKPSRATKPAVSETPIVPSEPIIVEVDYIGGPLNTTIIFNNAIIDFVNGKATVANDVATRLKTAELVK